MSEEMEPKHSDDTVIPWQSTDSENFTFARPSLVTSPEKVINFGETSEQVFFKRKNPDAEFIFAAPVSISDDYDFGAKISPVESLDWLSSRRSRIEGLLRDLDLAGYSKARRSSKSESKNSITCLNVPEKLLTKTAAREYFSAFGNVSKITLKPRKASITVCYVNQDAANTAYRKGGQFMGQKFDLHWTNSETQLKSPVRKKVSRKDAVREFITADEDEVNAELKAMMGLEYNLHGEKVPKAPIAEAKPRIKARKPKEILKRDKAIPKLLPRIEKSETEPQVQAIVPKANAEELHNIIRQAAHTSEEKYKVLDARDKLLRLKQIKPNTLAAAKVTIGTCPDMCPEKERLMRESQRQVALYEQMEGKEYRINHTIAVKQYSRSSADQEEPLAHELRPVKSLKMTMSYLLHEIMGMCMEEDTNLADWFHFLWDRTRGIRKDITQQELCCVDSVELVEQCARFHIFCSERLCAEEPSVFDKKINTENLTKCLQTLKYMYHDLRVKGVACRNEPEFRGYIILLNLNDGNFMWDLQKLPPDVQKSYEVRFAIQVFSCLESHNFSKFFKLVKNTTYLNACILLRYFNQIRVKALSVMVKAYCRSTSTPFPLYELIDILGFEDETEAVFFCEQVGLSISNDELHIMLNRQNFTHPVSSIEQGRAISVVESKRTKMGISVGQCIAGGEAPEKTYKNHVPHNSFDSHGYLKSGAINVEDQTKQYKDKSVPIKTDPYEFTEVETSKPPLKLRSQTKIEDQTDSGTKKSGQTFLVGSSTKVTNTENVFNKNVKVPPLLSSSSSQGSFQKEESVFIKPSSVFHKPEASTPFGVKTEPNSSFQNKSPDFAAVLKHLKVKIDASKSLAAGDSRGSNLESRNKNSAVLPKPLRDDSTQIAIPKRSGSNNLTPQQGAEVFKLKDSSPFATAPKRNIFSGISQGNIFAKAGEGASIFGNQSSATQSEKIMNERKVLEERKKQRAEEELKEKKLEELQKQIQAEKLKAQEVERENNLKRIETEAIKIEDQLIGEVTKEMCSEILKEEVEKTKMYNTLSRNIADSVLNEVIQDMSEYLLTTEIEFQNKLDKISKRIKQRIVKKYYRTWWQNVTKKKRQRNALDDTPVWLQTRTVSECAKLLYHPEQDLVIKNMRIKKFKSDPEPPKEILAPVEVIIYAGIKENLKSSYNEVIPSVFWKLVISWPELENQILLWQHKKIMNTYLNPENYTEEPMIKIHKPNPYETVHICIRHFEGLVNEKYLIGTDGLLFLAASSENLNSVKRRLTKIILSRSKLMPIPIVVVFLGKDDLVPEKIELELDLEVLLESGYVSEYTVVFEKEISSNRILRLIQSAALWLTTNKSPLVPLEMDYLNQVLSNCLTQELWLR